MPRLLAALAASLVVAAPALAQDDKKPPQGEVDAKTRAAIQREVERAKEELRDEVRAEIQGAQSAAEFLGVVAEGPKLEFLQLDGYLRLRGQTMVNFDLTGAADANGDTLFPVPLRNPGDRDTLATANMRLRLEPTLNVSEHVRVRAQVDVLDNHVLGSSSSSLLGDPSLFYGSSRVVTGDDPRLDRPLVSPKRVWAEVQTPVGLLSFGRMPSHWGLGILTNAAQGIDDDFGDSVDRIQFALPPVSTPLGRLAFVPILDFDAEGVLHDDPRFASGVGQPFDADSADDARTWGLKIAKLDTEDETRRKLERNERSVSYGLYYNYRTQRFTYPAWDEAGFGGEYEDPDTGYVNPATAVERDASAHVVDLWWRSVGPRLRLEAELVGVYGTIGNAASAADPAAASGEILLRQWGGTFVTDYKLSPNKVAIGIELGVASGDDAPGFGNVPGRTQADGSPTPYGSVEGAQWRAGADRTIRNFRFNPAYRVDLVLWRHVLGQVTDAAYVKPKLRWDLLPGLALDLSVVYSRALFSESTPSAVADTAGNLVDEGSASLGLEADAVLTYTSGDGFQLFGEWGVLQPLGGLEFGGADAERAHFLAFGMAARF